MGNSSGKEASDRTASGVAKIRHIESILNVDGDEKRLFEDPYAEHFYPGATIVAAICGKRFLSTMASPFMLGLLYLLVGRTREFDERVLAAVAAGSKQVVILGAGYDMRGFRLGLPSDVIVFEVDQPDVQRRKKDALEAIKNTGKELTNESNVRFVPCDFNVETVEKLKDEPGYDPSATTVFTLEGVTQYIPKEATVVTLKAAKSVCGPGSGFIVSYVDQDVYDNPEKIFDPAAIKNMLADVAKVEPWVSGWSSEEFASLMAQHGFKVQRDISIQELITEYYQPACRVVPDNSRCALERYAWATKI